MAKYIVEDIKTNSYDKNYKIRVCQVKCVSLILGLSS